MSSAGLWIGHADDNGILFVQRFSVISRSAGSNIGHGKTNGGARADGTIESKSLFTCRFFCIWLELEECGLLSFVCYFAPGSMLNQLRFKVSVHQLQVAVTCRGQLQPYYLDLDRICN